MGRWKKQRMKDGQTETFTILMDKWNDRRIYWQTVGQDENVHLGRKDRMRNGQKTVKQWMKHWWTANKRHMDSEQTAYRWRVNKQQMHDVWMTYKSTYKWLKDHKQWQSDRRISTNIPRVNKWHEKHAYTVHTGNKKHGWGTVAAGLAEEQWTDGQWTNNEQSLDGEQTMAKNKN